MKSFGIITPRVSAPGAKIETDITRPLTDPSVGSWLGALDGQGTVLQLDALAEDELVVFKLAGGVAVATLQFFKMAGISLLFGSLRGLEKLKSYAAE